MEVFNSFICSKTWVYVNSHKIEADIQVSEIAIIIMKQTMNANSYVVTRSSSKTLPFCESKQF